VESPISTAVIVVFVLALVPYILAWKFILQLVREVNSRSAGNKVSIWWWHRRGWKMHRQFFPTSPVRGRIVTCIALAVGIGLLAFSIATRNLILHPPTMH
jgi:hypothetical protein